MKSVRGSNVSKTLTIVKGGVPQDLSSSRVVFIAKISDDDPDTAAISFHDNSLIGGITNADQAATPGVCNLVIPGSDTYTRLTNEYVQLTYQVWISDATTQPWCASSDVWDVLPRTFTAQP